VLHNQPFKNLEMTSGGGSESLSVGLKSLKIPDQRINIAFQGFR